MAEVAAELGLAVGSIGLPARNPRALRRQLEELDSSDARNVKKKIQSTC